VSLREVPHWRLRLPAETAALILHSL